MAADVSASTIESVPTIFDWCEDWKGTGAVIEFGRGFEAHGTLDCIKFTDQQGLVIVRILSQRLSRLVQRLQPAFVPAPESKITWLDDSPRVDPLPTAIAAAGIAVDVDGRNVYVAAAVPTQLLIFDRSLETGVLRFRGLRTYETEIQRWVFLAQTANAFRASRFQRQRAWSGPSQAEIDAYWNEP
jgi:hypothetical protein